MRSESLSPRNREPIWDWGLLFSILFMLALPAVYQSYSIYLVGNQPPGDQTLAIVAQWQFVQVGMEVIQEGLILPLFYLVGQLRRRQPREMIQQIQTTGLMVVLVLVPFFLLVGINVPLLVDQVDTVDALQSATEQYLRIRLVGLFWGILNLGLLIVLESLRLRRLLVAVVVVKVFLSLMADSLFYGDYSFSLGLGAAGVAWSHLLVELLTFLVAVGALWKHSRADSTKSGFKWPTAADWRQFGQISGWVFLESLVRNLAYLFVILKLINSIGADEIAAYYLCMHLLWSFALLPVLAISDISKVLIANCFPDLGRSRAILKNAVQYTAGVVVVWLISLVAIQPVIAFFSADEAVNQLALQAMQYLIPAYILLAINLSLSSVFLGSGQTEYLAYSSLITNALVYVPAYLAYLLGWWVPTLTTVLLVFAVGIVAGTGLTIWYVGKLLSYPNGSRFTH